VTSDAWNPAVSVGYFAAASVGSATSAGLDPGATPSGVTTPMGVGVADASALASAIGASVAIQSAVASGATDGLSIDATPGVASVTPQISTTTLDALLTAASPSGVTIQTETGFTDSDSIDPVAFVGEFAEVVNQIERTLAWGGLEAGLTWDDTHTQPLDWENTEEDLEL
jgi:hypothetical protein